MRAGSARCEGVPLLQRRRPTTAEQPTLEVGRRMVDILLARLAGLPPEQVTRLSIWIADRGSQ